MKTSEVQIGACYKAMVDKKLVTVRIDCETSYRTPSGYRVAWFATNLATGRRITVKSPLRLRPLDTDSIA